MMEFIFGKLSTIGFYAFDLLKTLAWGALLLGALHFARKLLIHNINQQRARVQEVKQQQARKHHHQY